MSKNQIIIIMAVFLVTAGFVSVFLMKNSGKVSSSSFREAPPMTMSSSSWDNEEFEDFTVKKIVDDTMAGRYIEGIGLTKILHLKEDGSYEYYEDKGHSLKSEEPSDKKKTIQEGKWTLDINRLYLEPKINNVNYYQWDSDSTIQVGDTHGKMGGWRPDDKSPPNAKIYYDMKANQAMLLKAFNFNKDKTNSEPK